MLICSAMRRPKSRVETFSVSVDPRTKRILKEHAKRRFGGNMSALITAFGREAERREALEWLIRDAGGSTLTDELRREIDAELGSRRKKPAA